MSAADIVQQIRTRAEAPWDDTDVFDDLDRMLMNMAADEIEELRQAIWDAFIIMGGDHDGDLSHKAMSFPGRGWAGFLRDEARGWRADYDEELHPSIMKETTP